MTGILGSEVYWDKLSIGGAEDNERQGDSLGASSLSLRMSWWNGGGATIEYIYLTTLNCLHTYAPPSPGNPCCIFVRIVVFHAGHLAQLMSCAKCSKSKRKRNSTPTRSIVVKHSYPLSFLCVEL